MKYLDYLLAWTILLDAMVFILVIETYHLRGAILDIPFLWIVIAIINLLRLRNISSPVAGLRISCVATNLIGLILEGVRLKLCGVELLKDWGPYTAIAALAIFGEAIFSALPSGA